jgi:hypothetical protein
MFSLLIPGFIVTTTTSSSSSSLSITMAEFWTMQIKSYNC